MPSTQLRARATSRARIRMIDRGAGRAWPVPGTRRLAAGEIQHRRAGAIILDRDLGRDGGAGGAAFEDVAQAEIGEDFEDRADPARIRPCARSTATRLASRTTSSTIVADEDGRDRQACCGPVPGRAESQPCAFHPGLARRARRAGAKRGALEQRGRQGRTRCFSPPERSVTRRCWRRSISSNSRTVPSVMWRSAAGARRQP